ncbi:MAG: heme ABC transporter permease [Candidatus Competibacterales bacterium]|nr:heme ABC transporter permease [Candidatus Competibacterales bacterium]
MSQTATSAQERRRSRRFKLPLWLYKLASPQYFDTLSSRIIPWFLWPGLLLAAAAAVWGLAFAPADYQQGDSFRIIYVHVPAAALSMGVYVAMAVTAAIGLVWRIRLAAAVSRNCAPIGAAFTFLALATGSLWGKPMWGTWWVWDARLTSELILLFLYLGYMGLQEAFDDREVAARAAGVLAIVGVVNIPIIHYSVEWWYTLHQGATVFKFDKPSIAPEMLLPLLLMLLAYALLAGANVLMRTRNDVLESELPTDD